MFIPGKLPTLPIWLKENWAISLALESSCDETCRTLRIRRAAVTGDLFYDQIPSAAVQG